MVSILFCVDGFNFVLNLLQDFKNIKDGFTSLKGVAYFAGAECTGCPELSGWRLEVPAVPGGARVPGGASLFHCTSHRLAQCHRHHRRNKPVLPGNLRSGFQRGISSQVGQLGFSLLRVEFNVGRLCIPYYWLGSLSLET